MWLLFVIINMFINGFLDIIEKKGSNKQPLHFWVQANLLYGIFNIILGILFMPSILTKFNFSTMILTFPITFLSALGYYCSVKAFQYSSVSSVSPILHSKIVLVLILSVIFINDKLSSTQLILIFLLLIFNILLNKDKKSQKSKKGILFALGFLFSNGLATFLNKIIINLVPDPISITFYIGITTIISIIIMVIFIRKFELLNIKQFKNKKYAILMESLEVVAMLLLRYAMIDGNVVIITAMTSSSIIIALILSKLIFKEKIDFKKWIIIIVIVICLALLSVVSM